MSQALGVTTSGSDVEALQFSALDRADVRLRIEEIGVLPSLRQGSAEAALFVAESLAGVGIPIIEITMTTPGAADVVSALVRRAPGVIIGAGHVNNRVVARQCLDAGVKFLATDALIPEVVELAVREGVAIISGAFTPTEIVAARNAGSDFVRVFPCDAAGGARYIRSVRAALPDVPLMAAGGVTQQTAFDIVAAGATALCVGRDLIPQEAIRLRQSRRIQELARRFLSCVDNGRIEAAGSNGSLAELK